ALVFDGATRYHYINGELVQSWSEPGGPLPANSKALEIARAPDYHNRTLNGYIDEVRLWNVARTQAQIRSVLQGFAASTPHVGLVAFWPLNGNENDIFAGHNGSLAGSPTPIF